MEFSDLLPHLSQCADDLVQDTMVKAWASRERFAAGTSIKAWTFVILRNLFLSQTTRDGFIDAYEQMLPDHSGGPLMSLSAGVDAVTRALTGRNASAAPGETSAWLQEINFYADKDKTDSYGFRSEGFGVAGGVEKGSSLGAFGVTAAFTSSDIKDPEAEAEEVLSANLLELGLYWRAQGQYWTTWARAAGGYASFSADRSLVAGGVYLNNTSDWHGWTAAAAGGASYERNYGRLNVRPEIYAEYFRLSEDARSETGGGDGFDLDIDGRDSHIFSAVAAMSTSSNTTAAPLPPSSSFAGTRFRPQASPTSRPTSGDPVKLIRLMPGWAESAAPVTAPVPGITLITPSGSPISRASRAR
jgi:hypothetical protein